MRITTSQLVTTQRRWRFLHLDGAGRRRGIRSFNGDPRARRWVSDVVIQIGCHCHSNLYGRPGRSRKASDKNSRSIRVWGVYAGIIPLPEDLGRGSDLSDKSLD